MNNLDNKIFIYKIYNKLKNEYTTTKLVFDLNGKTYEYENIYVTKEQAILNLLSYKDELDNYEIHRFYLGEIIDANN